jgi:hypothetical protein
MKKKTLTIKLLIFLFMVLFCVYGDAADNNKESFNIAGKLCDDSPDLLREKLARLEKSIGHASFEENFANLLEKTPVGGATVTLQGKEFIRDIKTDSEGKFKFADVPAGLYRISCEFKSKKSGEIVAINKSVVGVSKDVYVELSPNLITIKGRITDQKGIPVAKARITGRIERYDNMIQEPPEDTRQWYAVSDAEGNYCLTGIEPLDWFRLAAVPHDEVYTLDSFIISVKAKECLPKEIELFLITENVLNIAREFSVLMEKVVKETQLPQKKSALLDGEIPLSYPIEKNAISVDITIEDPVGL